MRRMEAAASAKEGEATVWGHNRTRRLSVGSCNCSAALTLARDGELFEGANFGVLLTAASAVQAGKCAQHGAVMVTICTAFSDFAA